MLPNDENSAMQGELSSARPLVVVYLAREGQSLRPGRDRVDPVCIDYES
jgi:hypothetical protein